MCQPTLLVIDDDEELGSIIRDAAELSGFRAESTDDPEAIMRRSIDNMPDVIVLDLVMPQRDGIEVMQHLSHRGCRSKFIMMSGYRSGYLDMAETLATGLGLHTIGLISKPVSLDYLENQFSRARRLLEGQCDQGD